MAFCSFRVSLQNLIDSDFLKKKTISIGVLIALYLFGVSHNCTLLNSKSNYLLKLANTDFDNHETVKFGCGCVEDSHE